MCVDGDVVRAMILHCPMMTAAMVTDQKLDLHKEHFLTWIFYLLTLELAAHNR